MPDSLQNAAALAWDITALKAQFVEHNEYVVALTERIRERERMLGKNSFATSAAESMKITGNNPSSNS